MRAIQWRYTLYGLHGLSKAKIHHAMMASSDHKYAAFKRNCKNQESIMKTDKNEFEVLKELEALASSPGYFHAIAHLCFRDNFVSYSENATPAQFAKLYSSTRLIRTEISTLIGLALKHPIDWRLPTPEALDHYITLTESLLDDLHDTLNAPMFDILKRAMRGDRNEDPFSSGSVLREPVFYGSESAYTFQYRDLSPRKYQNDNEWLCRNKGFPIEHAKYVAQAAGSIVTRKLLAVLLSLKEKHPNEWTVLPAFELWPDEIASETGLSKTIIEQVLSAFSVPDQPANESFVHLNDFNIHNAYPLISRGDGSYLSFQHHSLLEAIYETPFYWMVSDESYIDRATSNRGNFLENISHELLVRVFGEERVFSNVLIIDQRQNRAAEIDTLVVFGNRAIVVQAKSKRMTIEARKGNDKMIRTDFAKSVQASYDQGLKCAELIGDTKYSLALASNNEEISLEQLIDKVYVFCLLSDHYPALSAQARHLLKVSASERIPAPFVMDVFLLDAMTEMLRSPLHFLNYVDRRVSYNDRVMASHELTILSYHLKLNLWVDSDYNLMQLGDDISTDLDLAMMVRRDGLQGSDTPDGILTRLKGTTFERIIQQIDHNPHENAVDLGLFLLRLSQETASQISDGIDRLSAQALLDASPHDFTVGAGGEGLTVHINDLPMSISEPMLKRHCERKKYQQRSKRWLGVLMPSSGDVIRAIGKLDFRWKRDAVLEAEIAAIPGTKRFTKPIGENGRKIGRNDPCPCGSGKKFKKCCL
jgi:hypothetical protein